MNSRAAFFIEARGTKMISDVQPALRSHDSEVESQPRPESILPFFSHIASFDIATSSIINNRIMFYYSINLLRLLTLKMNSLLTYGRTNARSGGRTDSLVEMRAYGMKRWE